MVVLSGRRGVPDPHERGGRKKRASEAAAPDCTRALGPRGLGGVGAQSLMALERGDGGKLGQPPALVPKRCTRRSAVSGNGPGRPDAAASRMSLSGAVEVAADYADAMARRPDCPSPKIVTGLRPTLHHENRLSSPRRRRPDTSMMFGISSPSQN